MSAVDIIAKHVVIHCLPHGPQTPRSQRHQENILLDGCTVTFQYSVPTGCNHQRDRERWAGVWKLESKLSAEQILHSNLKQRKWSIGHVAIRKFHASLTQSSCLSSPDWTLFCPRTLSTFHSVPIDLFFSFSFLFLMPFRAFQYFIQCGHPEILRLLRTLCNQTSIVALGPDTCGLLWVDGVRPAEGK